MHAVLMPPLFTLREVRPPSGLSQVSPRGFVIGRIVRLLLGGGPPTPVEPAVSELVRRSRVGAPQTTRPRPPVPTKSFDLFT